MRTTLLVAAICLAGAPLARAQTAAPSTIPTADWFAYRPAWVFGASAINMDAWLDKPAGKHGPVKAVADHFELSDGTPIKFWGANLSYGSSAPEKVDADFTAARFARYGINAVRMHKFTGAGWEGIGDENDSTRFVPAALDRLDYFAGALAQRGVYYGWSHTYHFKVRKDNKNRIAGFDELMKKGGDTYGVINWAEDVQDLMIEQVVNLLNHKNPYTGKTYAQDPALNFIELQNEDDIFFYTSDNALKDFPTYRDQLQQHFAQWLTARYGTQDKLAAAWKGALNRGETLAAHAITVQANPWFESDQHLPSLSGGERQRALDNAAFLFDTQKKFYDKFARAIRATGYAGPLIGSPWQAPAMLPHYYNLLADTQVGVIDRHDYFGGGQDNGGGLNDTMLKAPGTGYFSAGLQQVAGRPFSLSEWIHVYPSLYSAEGPVIIAAYGLGLQGWDAAYEFQSTSNKPADSVGNLPWGIWNADQPTQIGLAPVLSRMILRGDVKEAPVLSVRKIAPADLANGIFNFRDTVEQKGDIKNFGGTAPPEVLAVGKALVEFVDAPAASSFPDLTRYREKTTLVSATGQLRWDTAGFITINTPGTQGLVGFANGKEQKLADITLTSQCPYAAILLTAEERAETLANARRVLLAAVARNANTGFKSDGKSIQDNGKGPILLEPVKARIAFTKRKVTQVNILDHDGRPTDRNLPTDNGAFTIDGVKDKTLYYEVVLE